MRGLIALAAICVTACSAPIPRVLLPTDAGVDEHDVGVLIEAHPLPPQQNILSVLLGRTEGLSYHLVQIRSGESPHIHANHDLVVTLLRGRGDLHAGARIVPMEAGDTAVVRRGQVHYFINLGQSPAAAFVTFTPPFDGTDIVPIQ
jgi:mannose-6-phosphate isomerase-like protein (cupin superfamily)